MNTNIQPDEAPDRAECLTGSCLSCGWPCEEGYIICADCDAQIDDDDTWTGPNGQFGVGA